MATEHRTKRGDDDQVLVPAVAYVRCSTDDQIEASIPAQRAAIEQWAAENGYRILRWYVDEGISGWKEERAGFQSLMSDLDKRGDFRAVICWHTNRFSRFPVLEANHFWYLLDRAGVHLTTVVQGRQDWQDIGSWLKASIEQHGDAQYSHKLSADVKRGLRRVAESGCWVGRIPTGYAMGPDRRLVPNGQADLVTGIFRDCRNGDTLRAIAKQMNLEGIPSPRGGTWGRSTINSILSNEAYTGLARIKDIEIPGAHPALIDPETWRIVQDILTARKGITTPMEGGGPFLLTGLLKCGKCGCAMRGRTETRNYQCYVCSGYSERGICEKNMTHQDELVGYTVDAIEQHWMDSKTVARLRQVLRDLVDAETPKADPKQLEKQLATITTKLDKAKRRLVEVDRDMLGVVQDQIRELRAQQEGLEAALKAAIQPRGALLATVDERIDAAVKRFTELRQVLERADLAQRREVLRQTLSKVEVWTHKDSAGHRGRYHLARGKIHLRGVSLVHLTQLL